MIAHVEKALLQTVVEEDEHDLFRILWITKHGKLITYQFNMGSEPAHSRSFYSQ